MVLGLLIHRLMLADISSVQQIEKGPNLCNFPLPAEDAPAPDVGEAEAGEEDP